MMEQETCETCKFWECLEHEDFNGFCRHNSPSPVSYAWDDENSDDYTEDKIFVSWPKVDGDQWCGDHEQKGNL